MTRDDVKHLQALCVAYLRLPWTQTDVIVGSDVVVAGLVEFEESSKPRLTDAGFVELAQAVVGMKGGADG